MRTAHIGWFALAVVTTAAACGDRVFVGAQPSGLGSGKAPASSPPLNQAPTPTSPTMQPTTQPTTQPMPGTPPPACPSTATAQFVPGPNSPVGGIFSLAYSPGGQIIAAGIRAPQPNVRLWNAADSTVLRDIVGHGSPLDGVTYAVAFSPSGEILATAGLDGTGTAAITDNGFEIVKLWDVASGNLLRVIPVHCGSYADSVAFSHDGTLLATSGYMGPIEIWRVADGSLLNSIPYPTTVYDVRFSPDDARILTSGLDGVATLWRVADGSKVLTLSGHAGGVGAAAYSPDGHEIVTGGFDDAVRLWDAASGAPLETLTGHSAYLSRVRWIDQNRLASNDWKGTVILWTRDASGSFTRSCSLSGDTFGLDVSPDRTKLVASGSNGTRFGFWIFFL